jgi:fatty-acyl-CoA synthase/long-chain acyl-CoA synthetase
MRRARLEAAFDVLEDEAARSGDALAPSRKPGGHILLTSGTTGTYKMVLIDHAIDSFQMRRKMDILNLNEDTVFCVFDFTPWTSIGYRWAAAPLVAGGTMVIDQGREPYRALQRPGITHAVLTPSRLDPILAAPEGTFVRNETMQLIVGGGTLTLRQIEDIKARLTPRIFNCLASTEASIIAHTPLVSVEDMRWHRIIPDRAVEVVDDSDRPVAVGEIGRLRVGTAHGSTEYLDNAEATAAFFKNGYFYPGDLAITRSDGRIALQGRSTDVINLKGRKFFPGPIEDQLQKLLDVTGVCLFSMQNNSGEEELHVAIETLRPLEDTRLHTALETALKPYPRAHIHVRYFPLLPRNPMGKIERQAVRYRVKANVATTSRI